MGSLRLALFTLDPGNLFDALFVAAAGKGRSQPVSDDVASLLFIEEARADGEHVGVVVLAAELGLGDIRNMRGADAGNFVGGDGHSDTAAAHQNAEVGAMVRDALADLLREVGIVNRFG